MRDLNEISARVVKHRDGRSRSLGRLFRELHAQRLEPVVLFLDIPDEEICGRYPAAMDPLLIGLRRRVEALASLKDQLHAFRFFGGDHREPSVIPTAGKIMFLLEAKHDGVELQCLFLVVDKNAGEFDLHGLSSLCSAFFSPTPLKSHSETITEQLLIVNELFAQKAPSGSRGPFAFA